VSGYWIGWLAKSWGSSWGDDVEVEDKIKWDDVGGGPERHELDDWDYPLPQPRRSRDDKDMQEIVHMLISVSDIL
jgi:hypothetical protein